MRIIVCENYEEMSREAAKLIESLVNLKPDCVLGLATGSTPVGMYDVLCESFSRGKLDLSNVITFNLDEYYPIEKSNSESYDYFMREHLFSKVNIKENNIHIPSGEVSDPQAECERYEKMIVEAGGIDLQILGIGVNGHIGFNEPDSKLYAKTHLTDLTQSTIEANSRFFASADEVPRNAITMGIATILKAKKIVLLASGAGKNYALSELLKERIDTNIPATLLNAHNDVVVICDKEAYYGK